MRLVDRAAYGVIVIGSLWVAYREAQIPGGGRLGLVLLVGLSLLFAYIVLAAFVLWPRYERKIRGD